MSSFIFTKKGVRLMLVQAKQTVKNCGRKSLRCQAVLDTLARLDLPFSPMIEGNVESRMPTATAQPKTIFYENSLSKVLI